MATALAFWFEFASTYSYPAAMRIERLAAEAGAPLIWRPFLLGPIFTEQGWYTSPFNIYPAKGKYMWRDLERTCAELGLPFRKPSVFPRNGLLPARIATAFADAPWIGEFVRGVYTTNFARDEEISDPAVVAAVLSAMGQNPGAVIAMAESPESKALLRAQTEQAVEHGIFGAPTVTVDEELFWGNDRLEDAIRWWKRCQALTSRSNP
jgi:2-hydroxychromene-2-carboxylate isomerase